MNVWKKIGALTFIIALAMSFCVMASADAESATLTAAATTATDNGLNEVIFSVKLADAVASTPRPGTKFTYTVAADGNNKEGAPSVSFNATQPTQATGITVEKSGDNAAVTFPVANDGADATAAVSLTIGTPTAMRGDFKYTITQAALDSTAVTAGFKSNDTNGAAVAYTLELAVNGTKVTQAALWNDATSPATPAKVAGFMNNTYTAAQAVEVTKYVASAGTGKDDFFDFSIAITASSTEAVNMVGLNITLDTTGDVNKDGEKNGFANATDKALASGANTITGVLKAADGGRGKSAISGKLTDDNVYKLSISNLPGGVAVTVTETYAYATDGYELQTSSKTGASYADAAENNTGSVALTTSLANTVGAKFFNILEDISLTGVTLRYAPYLLTLGAGVTALPLTRRYKKREDEV